LDIVDGKAVLTGEKRFFPTIEDLFAYKFSSQNLCGVSRSKIDESPRYQLLHYVKRPIKIRYIMQDQQLRPKVNGETIDEPNLESLIKYGYAILDGRLLSCTLEARELLNRVAESLKLKDLLSIVAELQTEKLLDSDTKDIIASLLSEPLSDLIVEKDGTFKHKLYPYQRDGVQWLLYCYLNQMGAILADDMGLGKTAQIIALIAECRARSILNNAIIVVPNSLLENWKREFEFFFPSIKPYFHCGSIRSGLSEELKKYLVVIIPYSILVNDIEMISEINTDLLVYDEASLLKNPDSERTIASKRIQSGSVIAMTGTPIENSLKDLWSIADLVFPGYLGTQEGYISKYISRTISETLENDLSTLEEQVRQITLRRMKIDILKDLPDKVDIHQPISMYDSERAKCDSLIASIRDNQGASSFILQEINKLQQFTSHPELLNDGGDFNLKTLKEGSAKFTRLMEQLDEIASRKEKVLVFANHHKMIDILKVAIWEQFNITAFNIDGRINVDERQLQIDRFSSEEGFSVMVLNPRTAGMGLNITSANHVIHYSRQWNPALEEQATARAFRNGQTKDVNVYYLFYVDSIEEVIDERLRLKKELSERVVRVVDEKQDELDIMMSYIRARGD